MYIDVELIRYINNNYGGSVDVEKVVEECGIWYTVDGIKAETEDFDATLEEIFSEHYFIIENNTILFCPVNQLIDDIEDYLYLNG